MLDEIKEVLGISDSSKDALINYHIKSISEEVLNYCNLTQVPNELETFIEKKIIAIMKYESNNYKGVKSITEGDTKIDFAIENNGVETLTYSLNDFDKKTLRNFRKVKF